MDRAKTKIKIQDRWIGQPHRCFIVAEAGSNHNGKLELAKMLIEAAKACGADAVKFQAFKTENLVTKKAAKADYQKSKSSGRSQFEMLKALELTPEEYFELVATAKDIGIPIFYSVFDTESADAIEQAGIDIFKLGSGELTNIPLIRHIAQKAKPLIISTGMGTDAEIQDAVDTFRAQGNEQLILMHCSTGYPSSLKDANLRRIKYLGKKFGVICGNSDHTQGIIAGIMAAALGTPIIEKHFTLDNRLAGPDQSMSMNPKEMKKLCSIVRSVEKNPVAEDRLKEVLKKVGLEATREEIETILGSGGRQLSEVEIRQRSWARKSLVAKKDIIRGEVLTHEKVAVKRPEEGILPRDYEKVLGMRARHSIKEGVAIKWDMLE